MNTTKRMVLAMLGLALALAGCVGREPLNQAIVSGNADALQRRESLIWGDPIEVLAPEPGPGDRHYWQVRYRDGGDGLSRIILVDDDTGWARLPPAGFVPRVAPQSRARPAGEARVEPGPYLLLAAGDQLTAASHRAELDAEVKRLNELAERTGLAPLFSVRASRGDEIQIVYGWQNNRGIARDEHVRDWLTVRTEYAHPTWWKLSD